MIIYGKNINLRTVEIDDAEFVFNMRQNQNRAKYLTKITGTVESQREWIKNYKQREKEGKEYYFVIESKDGEKLGLVRMYDFRDDSFCWGSWIIKEDAPKTTAIESALPGGPVFIHRGLLLTLDNESELAGVIAHELGHINARHHAKFLEKTYGLNILLNILAVATSQSQYHQIVMQLAQVSAGLLQLKYSRDQEREADALGVRFTYEAGYDPRGLITTFEKFKKMEKTHAPAWLLTHPLPEERMQNVSQLIATKYPDKLLLKKDSEKFQEIKKRLILTSDSYKYVENAKDNIKNKNLAVALTNLDKAIKTYPENNLAYTYRAYVYYQLKDFKKSYEDALRAYSIDRMYFMPQLIMGASLTKLGNYQESIRVLENAKNLIDSDPDLYYFLGVSYQSIGDRQNAYNNLVTALKLTDGRRGWEQDAQNRLRMLVR